MTFVTVDTAIISRMTKRPAKGAADVPLTSSRALRLAVTRAADRALGMTLNVVQVAEEILTLDSMLAGLPADMSYVRLERSGALAGFIAFDLQLRAATIEIQTIGTVSANVATERAHTGTDMMLAAPLSDAVLSLLPQTTQGSDLEGWSEGATRGDPFENLRAAGLALTDADYRVMRVTVDLVPDSRQGTLIIALPNHQSMPVEALDATSDVTWDTRMHATVSDAPAALRAVLHQMNMPLGQVNALKIGSILPLYGATVGSVRLFAPDETCVGTARLGQSMGMRAVRIQPPPVADLRDIPAPATPQIDVTNQG